MDIPVEVLSAILALLISIPPIAIVWAKRHKARELINLVFDVIDDAKITKEEAEEIKKKIKELLDD